MIGSWAARLAVQATYARTPELPVFTAELSFFTSSFSLLTSLPAALLFSLPALVASRNGEPSLSALEIGAAVMWVIAFAGETTADRQRLRVQATTADPAVACRSGVWRRLPHAHAVFEMWIWIALALFALASPWGWIAAACPAARLYLLTRRY